MKRTLLFLVISGTAALIITGCSKKNDSQSYSVAQLVGTYKMTASTLTAGGVTHDNMQDLEDCEKETLTKIKADSTVEITTTCNGGNTGTGEIIIKGNLLINDPAGNPDTATIKSFNGTALVLTYTYVEQNITVLDTDTYTKQ